MWVFQVLFVGINSNFDPKSKTVFFLTFQEFNTSRVQDHLCSLKYGEINAGIAVKRRRLFVKWARAAHLRKNYKPILAEYWC